MPCRHDNTRCLLTDREERIPVWQEIEGLGEWMYISEESPKTHRKFFSCPREAFSIKSPNIDWLEWARKLPQLPRKGTNATLVSKNPNYLEGTMQNKKQEIIFVTIKMSHYCLVERSHQVLTRRTTATVASESVPNPKI